MRKLASLLAALLLLACALPALATEGDAFIVGDYVTLDNGDQVWVSRYGEGAEAIVFFAGFGASSPTYEFIPMIEEINEKLPQYTVYVYDYPGTGRSGQASSDRTLDNITAEIHETMGKLGIDTFTPIVHSISGAYLLQYMHQYPGDVARIVCIDNSVPKQSLVTPYDEMMAYYDGAIAEFAAIDWDAVTPETNPEFYYLPDGYAFTPEQVQAYTQYVANAYNETMVAELYAIEDNLKSMLDLTFPTDVDALLLVSTGTQAELPEWHALHEEVIAGENQEMVVVEGSHYLHYDARDAIMPLILDFLGA